VYNVPFTLIYYMRYCKWVWSWC